MIVAAVEDFLPSIQHCNVLNHQHNDHDHEHHHDHDHHHHQEFLDAMHQFAGQTPEDKIKFLFKVYDIDGEFKEKERKKTRSSISTDSKHCTFSVLCAQAFLGIGDVQSRDGLQQYVVAIATAVLSTK